MGPEPKSPPITNDDVKYLVDTGDDPSAYSHYDLGTVRQWIIDRVPVSKDVVIWERIRFKGPPTTKVLRVAAVRKDGNWILGGLTCR